jgi:hypothetical protein
MKTPFRYLLGVAGAGFLLFLTLPATTRGDAATDTLNSLLDDLTVQQGKLEENQVKIDEKIALIAEEVRQARLYVARGGGKK